MYGELEHEGVLTTRPGLGVFVAKPGSELSRKVRNERLREAANRFLTEAVHLGFSADEVMKLLVECEKQFQWRNSDLNRESIAISISDSRTLSTVES